MEIFRKNCSKLLSLFIGLAIVLIFFKSSIITNWNDKTVFSYKLTFLIALTLFLGIFIINLSYTERIKIILLLTLSLLIRVWWIINVDSVPVSDFNTMYLSAKELLNGNMTSFRGYGYLARFPHLVCTTLYMAVMIKVFPVYHLIVIKIVNVILSVFSIYLLYKLSQNFTKKDTTSLGIVLLSIIFPPFISYSSTFCTENLAIPLYLITMISFFKANKNNNWSSWIICGILLSLSNLFRGVGIIFFIAFLIYIFIFTKKRKILNFLGIFSGFILTTFLVSITLMEVNIIENPLWKGSEPSIVTLLLKGSNVENGGRWNLEDARFVDENLLKPDFSKKCVEIAINRISKISIKERINFFFNKFLSQWAVGDFSGTYWATLGINMGEKIGVPLIFQVIFSIIMFFSLIGIIGNINRKEVAILYILLCGFILMFMIMETQSRYSYIISWVFLILATEGIETVKKSSIKIRNKI